MGLNGFDKLSGLADMGAGYSSGTNIIDVECRKPFMMSIMEKFADMGMFPTQIPSSTLQSWMVSCSIVNLDSIIDCLDSQPKFDSAQKYIEYFKDAGWLGFDAAGIVIDDEWPVLMLGSNFYIMFENGGQFGVYKDYNYNLLNSYHIYQEEGILNPLNEDLFDSTMLAQARGQLFIASFVNAVMTMQETRYILRDDKYRNLIEEFIARAAVYHTSSRFGYAQFTHLLHFYQVDSASYIKDNADSIGVNILATIGLNDRDGNCCGIMTLCNKNCYILTASKSVTNFSVCELRFPDWLFMWSESGEPFYRVPELAIATLIRAQFAFIGWVVNTKEFAPVLSKLGNPITTCEVDDCVYDWNGLLAIIQGTYRLAYLTQ